MNKPFGVEFLEPLAHDVSGADSGCTFGFTFLDGGQTKVMDAFC